jgi:hypothetical protein
MDTAISVLQHLAAIAAYEGEECAKVLFGAADYLQDVLDCSPALALGYDDEVQLTEWQDLMAKLPLGVAQA